MCYTDGYTFAVVRFLIIIALLCIGQTAFTQTRTYFTWAPSSGRNSTTIVAGLIGSSWSPTGSASIADVTNPANAADPLVSNYTVLKAADVNIAIIEYAGEAWVQPKLSSPLTAGTTTYIRIDPIEHSGLALSALNLLGLLGDAIRTEAYTGATNTAGGAGTISGVCSSRIIIDKDGKYYVAVTPSAAYNSVRIYLRYSSGLLGLALGSSYTMKVYNAFYTSPDCGDSWATDLGQQTGLSLSLTDAVQNPGNAIDASESSYSELQTGLVALGATVTQTVFFSGYSSVEDQVRTTISIPSSLLEANLFSSIKVQAYNGTTAVGTEYSLSSILSVDALTLLSLFANEAEVSLTFKPGVAFDRVRISSSSFLSIGNTLLGGGLNIYNVERTPPDPASQIDLADNTEKMICESEAVALGIKSPLPGYDYDWYTQPSGGTVYKQQTTSFTESALSVGAHYFYAEAKKTGCSITSNRTKVKITVQQKPQAPAVVITSN
jgi:hypothetical protein